MSQTARQAESSYANKDYSKTIELLSTVIEVISSSTLPEIKSFFF
jgi:hypothetical protein